MINKDKMLKANQQLDNFLDIDIKTVDILRACKAKDNFLTLLKTLTEQEIIEILQDFEDSQKINQVNN